MGQEETNPPEEEKEEEKDKKKLALPFNFSFDSFLKEILRFVIFLLFAFIIVFFVQGGGADNSFSLDEIRNIDNQDLESITSSVVTVDWVSDEMLINTADEFANHFVRAVVVVAYEDNNSDLNLAVLSNQNLFYATIRRIISKRTYLELKNPNQQELIIEEIKIALQRVVQIPGIKKVFFRDFTVH